jgi:hypothetical protein
MRADSGLIGRMRQLVLACILHLAIANPALGIDGDAHPRGERAVEPIAFESPELSDFIVDSDEATGEAN